MSVTTPTRRNTISGQDLALMVTDYAELLAAARATVAAAALGEVDPLIHLRHTLAAHGQLPPVGARPAVLLAQYFAPALPRLTRAKRGVMMRAVLAVFRSPAALIAAGQRTWLQTGPARVGAHKTFIILAVALAVILSALIEALVVAAIALVTFVFLPLPVAPVAPIVIVGAYIQLWVKRVTRDAARRTAARARQQRRL